MFIVHYVVFPIWQTVQYPVILDGLMNRPFRIMGAVYDEFLIEWVAIQYYCTPDSSCLYLARLSDSPKYSTDSSNH